MGERDVFVFDTSILGAGISEFKIANFEEGLDRFAFTNFELDGDGQLINQLGDLFVFEGSVDAFNEVDFSGHDPQLIVSQERSGVFAESFISIFVGDAGDSPLVSLTPPPYEGYSMGEPSTGREVAFFAEDFFTI